jgi:hypothetical protein
MKILDEKTFDGTPVYVYHWARTVVGKDPQQLKIFLGIPNNAIRKARWTEEYTDYNGEALHTDIMIVLTKDVMTGKECTNKRIMVPAEEGVVKDGKLWLSKYDLKKATELILEFKQSKIESYRESIFKIESEIDILYDIKYKILHNEWSEPHGLE